MSSNDSGSPEKTLPPGADGDDSVVIDNGAYDIDIGETESGTWIWNYQGHTTLYHEFFALGNESEIVASYNQDSVEKYFPDTVQPTEKASAVIRYTVDGVPLRVKRTVRMHDTEPTFTMKYDISNVGSEAISPWIAQYADFDDGSNDFTDDVGHYDAPSTSTGTTGDSNGEFVYVRDHAGEAYAGFSGNIRSDEHLVDDYPGYDEVLNDNFDNDDRYPSSGAGDAIVAMKWQLGQIQPGQSESITLQWGARDELEDLSRDLEEPEPIETEPPLQQVSGSASVVSWSPGLSENEQNGGDDMNSVFPNQGPLPGMPVDGGFVADKKQHMGADSDDEIKGENVQEVLNMRKNVEGLEGEEQGHRQYRCKDTVEVTFGVTDDGAIDRDQPIEVGVNVEEPEAETVDVRIDGDEPDVSIGLLNPDDPEPLPTTVVEENVNDHVNPTATDLYQWGENDRVREVRSRPRFVTVTVDEFDFRGETQEGVRIANLWGTENPYTYDWNDDWFAVVGGNPIIYHWIDFVVLADGTRAVRLQDAPTFPMHTLYTGPAGSPAEQEKRTDSGLEVIFDQNETTSNEYRCSIGDDNHAPWSQFFEAFEDGTKVVPYTTPQKKYVKHHNNDTTNRWIGYENEKLLDHPIIRYGRDGDGNTLSESDVSELLPSAQVPFPDLL